MLGLDYETFSEVNLPERGLDNYVNHPSTRPLLASVAVPLKGGVWIERFDFVTADRDAEMTRFLKYLEGKQFQAEFVAHNASFERAITRMIGGPGLKFIDSAAIARTYGAGSKLEAAAPQLLGVDKMADGVRLIKKFSMPQKDGYVYVDDVENWTDEDWKDWETFGEYCDLDATLGLQIAKDWHISFQECQYEQLTQKMNERGWPVDLGLVELMDQRYRKNLVHVERNFRRICEANLGEDEKPLNFRSTTQLRKWVRERGLRVKSFDEQSVASLIPRVEKRLGMLRAAGENDPRIPQLEEVLLMLETKQELGGSSLSKLETIKNLTGPDGRLRNQYLHVGAGQTYRTSGRGVQLQNLKRLGRTPDDLGMAMFWDNETLARNIRQVFTAGHPKGRLIVGDFSSVESRGLAMLAGAEWKLDVFRQGKDMYKMLASSMLGVPYDAVSKEQRQTGKVGELACGYGAGPKAVRSFAAKMGEDFTEDEAAEIVYGWRETNPEIVMLWRTLDRMLDDVVRKRKARVQHYLGNDLTLTLARYLTPDSLTKQIPDAQTIQLQLHLGDRLIMARVFQGCFLDGDDICYVKPSELKSGDLWRDWWTKDGARGRYKLYGGKLAGILTQSFCRELFFHSALELERVLSDVNNAQLIGQFHDELVVEWAPDSFRAGSRTADLQDVSVIMAKIMSAPLVPGFPLEADINSAYRYIK